MSEYSHFGGKTMFGASLLQSVVRSSGIAGVSTDFRKCSSCDGSCGSFSSSCSCRIRYRTLSKLSADDEDEDEKMMVMDEICSSSSVTKTVLLSPRTENTEDYGAETTVGVIDRVESQLLSRISVDSVDGAVDRKRLGHEDLMEASDPWTSSSRTVASMQVDDSSTIEDLETCTLQTIATVESDSEDDPVLIEDEVVVASDSKPTASKEASTSKKSKTKRKKAQKTLNDKLHKTELCKMYMKDGKCKFGKACAFAHGESELKPAPPKHPKYKSIPCKNLKKKGFCPFGDKCVFIH